MKAVIDPIKLLKELKKFSLVVKKNPIIPIMSTVLFEFDKNKLTLRATDLETTYISVIDCESKDKFALPIEHDKIQDVCSNVHSPISLEFTEKVINIVSGKAKYNFSISGKATDFPILPTDDFDLSVDVDGDFYFHLNNANQVRSKNDDMVNFNMAALDIKKKSLFVVATDGNNVYKKELPIKSSKEVMVMVPDKFVTSCKAFQSSKIYIGDKFVKAEHGNEIVISRLSEQKFPNYNAVIAPEIDYNLVIQKEELKSAIASVSVVDSAMTYNQCVVSFSKKGFKITSQSIDSGSDAEMDVEVEHYVEKLDFALNATILTKLLSLIEAQTISMSFTNPMKAVYIKPEDDDSLLILTMPLKINS